MFNWTLIQKLSDIEILCFVLVIGMLGWLALIAIFIALSKLWDKVTASAVYQCERLRRENARLRKKLREGAQQNARR